MSEISSKKIMLRHKLTPPLIAEQGDCKKARKTKTSPIFPA